MTYNIFVKFYGKKIREPQLGQCYIQICVIKGLDNKLTKLLCILNLDVAFILKLFFS